jgi:hypothetical protein
MQTVRLLVALLLPWVVGVTWLLALRSPTRRTSVLQAIAYGHLVGILVLTLIMRAATALGLRWSFIAIAAALGVLLIAGIAVRALPARRSTAANPRPIALDDPFAWRWLAVLASVLLAIRLANLAAEVMLRPLYPWDAWTQWATKAKVWSALHAMVPFIDYSQWLARQPGYVDTAPHYPATVPLLQAWMALAIGNFDDVLVNLPWLAICVALAAGIHGQMRSMGASRPWSLFVTYAALSLPLLDTHVALAGYADLFVAAVFTLGLLALVHWERERDSMQLVQFGIAVVLLPTLKVPGIVWSATLLLGLLVAIFGGTGGRVALIVSATSAITAGVVFLLFRSKIASVTGDAKAEVAQPLAANLFLFDNWHLLWYLVPIAVAVGWRDALHRMRGTSAALVAGFAFLWATFALTRAGNWVADYTTVNRALLHIAPAALVFSALLVREWALRRESATGAPTQTVSSSDPPRESDSVDVRPLQAE